jgi:hypothetical protein
MVTACEFRCLGGANWDKIVDACVPPDTCATPTTAGFFGQVVSVPCESNDQ